MSQLGGTLPVQKEKNESGQWHDAPLWALNKYGEAIDWTNDQVNLNNQLKIMGINPKAITDRIPGQLDEKILNYSYKDLRDDASRGAGWAAEKLTGSEAVGQGVELAGQILIPDAVDFATGGVGYIDNLAKIPKALSKSNLGPKLLKKQALFGEFVADVSKGGYGNFTNIVEHLQARGRGLKQLATTLSVTDVGPGIRTATETLSKNDWRNLARRLHVEEGLSMKEVRKQIGSKWKDPDTGRTFSIHTKNRGKDVVVINDESRKLRGQRRTHTTVINRDQVETFAKEFNQPSSVVDAFMKTQQEGKKVIDDLINKINNRIKAAKPGTYSENLKASLGHGKAAKRYQEGGADIVSNLDIEDHVTNIRRSNKDEISDAFNRALGRSTDVREEFMKFIDPDLGDFHKKAFRLGRHQKDKIIDYVAEGMKKDINWKSILSDSGEQLYSSKEEFLINEALQRFVK